MNGPGPHHKQNGNARGTHSSRKASMYPAASTMTFLTMWLIIASARCVWGRAVADDDSFVYSESKSNIKNEIFGQTAKLRNEIRKKNYPRDTVSGVEASEHKYSSHLQLLTRTP